MSYIFLTVVILVIVLIITIAAFTNFALDSEHYDRMKWLAMKWHYITAFVALLVKLFEFPYGMETVLIVAGIGACMAGLLGVSTKNYYAEQVQTTFNGESFSEMLSDFDACCDPDQEMEENYENEEEDSASEEQ